MMCRVAVTALLTISLLGSAAARAEVLIEQRRPDISDLSANNATNAEVVEALGNHLGFVPEIQDEVWGLQRRSFAATGSAEKLLTIALRGSSYLFSYTESKSIPSAVTVLSAGTQVSMFTPSPASLNDPVDPAEYPSGSAVSAGNQANGSGDNKESVESVSVSALLESQARATVVKTAPTPVEEFSQAQLANLTRRTHAGVIQLAEALKRAEAAVAR